MDGGDGQVGVAAPSDGEDPAAGDAALGEGCLDPGEDLAVVQWTARGVSWARRFAPGDVQARACLVFDEMPRRGEVGVDLG